MNSTQEILTNLKSYLNANTEQNIRDVILFGSRAFDRATEFSDYDVLVILKSRISNKEESRILDLCYDIDLKYNILLDVHLLSEAELETPRGKQPIFVNALNSGIYA